MFGDSLSEGVQIRMNMENELRFDCLKMKEDIQRKMNEEYPTMDMLYEHLVKNREKNFAFHEECARYYVENNQLW